MATSVKINGIEVPCENFIQSNIAVVDDKLVYEAADMMYHLIVMLTSKGLRIEDIAEELQKRHDPNWDSKRRQAKAAGQMK
jgi:phosphoribosyl-ATP pyrophosphohydrolase